jgi:hypothetical protein
MPSVPPVINKSNHVGISAGNELVPVCKKATILSKTIP